MASSATIWNRARLSGSGIATKTLPGADVDDAGDVVRGAGRDVGRQGPGPAYGEDQIDRTAVLDGGKGPGRGRLAGSSAGHDPLVFGVALCPEIDAAAGAMGPAADQRFHLAGEGGDDGGSGHARVGSLADGA